MPVILEVQRTIKRAEICALYVLVCRVMTVTRVLLFKPPASAARYRTATNHMTRCWRRLSSRCPEHPPWHPWIEKHKKELPAEDLVPEDGDAVGILRRSVYGFRKARVNWQRDWQKTFCEVGYNVGLATFCALLQRSGGSLHEDVWKSGNHLTRFDLH